MAKNIEAAANFDRTCLKTDIIDYKCANWTLPIWNTSRLAVSN